MPFIRPPGRTSSSTTAMFKALRSKKYFQIPVVDDDESLIADPLIGYQPTSVHNQLKRPASNAAVVILLLLSTLCAASVGRRYPSDDGAIRHISKYSKCEAFIPNSVCYEIL